MKHTDDLLINELGICPEVLKLVQTAEQEILPYFCELDDIMAYNQYKVLSALQKTVLPIITFPGIPDMATMIRGVKP